MSTKPRIVFLGTPEFAVPSLDILVRNGYEIAGVVTVPDKPAGRGQKVLQSPVKEYAVGKGLNVLQPVNLKDENFLDSLRSLQADLFIVVAFRMLPEAVWKMPVLGTFNLHGSLLPQYRGAAPINWALINGEKETGLTTFFLTHEIDTGRIIFREKLSIGSDENAGSLHDRMMITGAELVLKTVVAIERKNIQLTDQEQLIAGADLKPAPKLNKVNTRIDLHKTAEEVFNQIRGLAPYPAAHTEIFNAMSGVSFTVKVYAATFETSQHGKKAGLIETDNKGYLKVYFRKGIVNIMELQLSGRNRVHVKDFLNGFKLEGEWCLK